MATLYITEYDLSAVDRAGQEIPVAREPAVADQTISFSTAASSSTFNAATRIVRLYADAACHVKFGTSPTATASHQALAANTEYWRAVEAGSELKASVYDGSS